MFGAAQNQPTADAPEPLLSEVKDLDFETLEGCSKYKKALRQNRRAFGSQSTRNYAVILRDGFDPHSP